MATAFQDAWNKARGKHLSMFEFNGKQYSTRGKTSNGDAESDDEWAKGAELNDEQKANFTNFQNGDRQYLSQDGKTYGGYDITEIQQKHPDSELTAAINSWQQPETPPTVPSTPSPSFSPLTQISRKDVTSLGFNDYNSLKAIAGSTDYQNNSLIQAMKRRYGDVSTWNQNQIESDLGVSGRYRGNFLGDKGDIYRSMAGWIQGANEGYKMYGPQTNTASTDGTQITQQNPSTDIQTNTSGGTTGESISSANPETSNTSGTTPEVSTPKFVEPIGAPKRKKGWNAGVDFIKNLFGILSHQQGGKMNQKQIQQMFVQYLAKKSGAKTQEELQQYIQQLGKEGLQKEYAQFMQLLQNQSAQKAKHGAKLNMIARLNGITCPEGEELIYFQKGGKFCKKCIQRQQEMKAKFPQEAKTGTKFIKEFKYQIEASKCGSKMHK